MKPIKVSEASGAVLDWMVAKCEGEKFRWQPECNGIGMEFDAHHYSTDWAQGGPIIEREEIWLDGPHQARTDWQAHHGKTPSYDFAKTKQLGTTPLIAAMRCFVVSKLGNTVEVPDELA